MKSGTTIAALFVATAVAAVSTSVPAFGSSTHWSRAQCQTWKNGFVKRNPHATSATKAKGNNVLKARGCIVRIK
jgi:hypothetical protein